MKGFIIRTSLFVLPFFIAHLLNTYLYHQDEGDLVRIGYLYGDPSPKSNIKQNYQLSKKYELLSEIDLRQKHQYEVMTIGDSFSEQDSLGYKNYLAHQGISVLHVDRYISRSNPIQVLVNLINSDYFDGITVKTVVLQCVERAFVSRCRQLDYSRSTSLDSIRMLIMKHKPEEPDFNVNFFSASTIKIPFTNMQYLHLANPTYSKTFRFRSTRSDLFTNGPNDLLFYNGDIKNLSGKNDPDKVNNCVKQLNKINTLLNEKKINLIVLICPDKYDLYYPYIKNNAYTTSPVFFTIYSKIPKNYGHVNAYEILSKEIMNSKDVYYYDDTHWSPLSAQLIANAIHTEILAVNDPRQ